MAVDFLRQRWYVVVNDLVGGWVVSNVDKPAHALMFPPHGEEYMIAEMLTRESAEHVRDLHNAWLARGGDEGMGEGVEQR